MTKSKQEWAKKVRGLQLRTLDADGIEDGVFRFSDLEDFVDEIIKEERQRVVEMIEKVKVEHFGHLDEVLSGLQSKLGDDHAK